MTTSISPPIRILALVGTLAVLGLGLLLYNTSRSSGASSGTSATPVTVTHHVTATLPPTTKVPVAPEVALLPGLPASIAHALRDSKVIVVSLSAGGAAGDPAALQGAHAGAKAAHAGFAAINVLNERMAVGLGDFAGATATPTVLVIRRPGRIVNRFTGYADSDLVAQAAQNAGARGSR